MTTAGDFGARGALIGISLLSTIQSLLAHCKKASARKASGIETNTVFGTGNTEKVCASIAVQVLEANKLLVKTFEQLVVNSTTGDETVAIRRSPSFENTTDDNQTVVVSNGVGEIEGSRDGSFVGFIEGVTVGRTVGEDDEISIGT